MTPASPGSSLHLGMMRGSRVAGLGLLGLLLLPGACREPRTAGPGMCQTIAWGGFDGTPQCAAVSATVIAGEDRGCQIDADCTLVAVTNCAAHAVSTPAVPRYAGNPAPCAHPLNAFCAAKTFRAACDRGCCVATTAPPGPPGY